VKVPTPIWEVDEVSLVLLHWEKIKLYVDVAAVGQVPVTMLYVGWVSGTGFASTGCTIKCTPESSMA
jgi:hypothetical protein